jgi:ADP-ribosyl-[dinitrogen reductase] hydrolase
MAIEKIDRFRGSLFGLAVGDCMGVPAEFHAPGQFSPIREMTGGGYFHLQKGEWTDDTSMALCLAESLIMCSGFDAKDQIDRYVRWYKKGHNSSKGVCFDIGNTVRQALDTYLDTGEPYSGSLDPHSAGNGSLMRLAPVPLIWSFDLKKAVWWAGESSKTTHQAIEAVEACRLYGGLLAAAVQGYTKDELLSHQLIEHIEGCDGNPFSKNMAEVAEGSYKRKAPPEIKGSGYVVRSIEAALWAFYQTEDFSDGLLLAVNLGDDADTTGAIYGQLAGAFYGVDAIPGHWREALVGKERIGMLADALYQLHFSFAKQEGQQGREKAIFDVDFFFNLKTGDYVQFDHELLYVTGEEYEDENGKGMILERLREGEKAQIPKGKIKMADEVIKRQ